MIEYQGHVSREGDSQGHYICDIKDRLTGRWFRTNDNKIPIPIEIKEVSDLAYVIQYQKSSRCLTCEDEFWLNRVKFDKREDVSFKLKI